MRKNRKGNTTSTVSVSAGRRDVLRPDIYTQWKVTEAEIKGEATVQTLMLYSQPNVYVKLVSGGYNSALPTPSAHLSTVTTRWYSNDVDSVVADKVFARLVSGVGRRVVFTPADVQAYIACMSSLAAAFSAVDSWLSVQFGDYGTLGEVPQAVRAIFNHSYVEAASGNNSSDISDSVAILEEIRREMEIFPMPPMMISEIQRMFQPHRLGPNEDDPIGGFAPPLADHITAGTSFTGVSSSPMSAEALRQLVAAIRNNAVFLDIAAAIIRVTGGDSWRMNFSEFSVVSYDPQWNLLWENGGSVFDDATATSPQDMLVPTAYNADRSERALVPIFADIEPDDTFWRYFTHGAGKQVQDAAGYALLNYGAGADGDWNYSTNGLRVIVYANSSRDPESDPSAYTIAARTDDVSETMFDSSLRKGRLGWGRVIQQVASASVSDQLQGVRQSVPSQGRRYRVDTSRVREVAHKTYYDFWAL